jgi:hypothetical protein
MRSPVVVTIVQFPVGSSGCLITTVSLELRMRLTTNPGIPRLAKYSGYFSS